MECEENSSVKLAHGEKGKVHKAKSNTLEKLNSIVAA